MQNAQLSTGQSFPLGDVEVESGSLFRRSTCEAAHLNCWIWPGTAHNGGNLAGERSLFLTVLFMEDLRHELNP